MLTDVASQSTAICKHIRNLESETCNWARTPHHDGQSALNSSPMCPKNAKNKRAMDLSSQLAPDERMGKPQEAPATITYEQSVNQNGLP